MVNVALARLARFRADAYRLLSQIFLYPEPDRTVSIEAAASGLYRRRTQLTTLAIGHQWTGFLRTVQETQALRIGELQRQFTHVFGLDGAGGCPPYESHHTTRDPGQGVLLITAVEQEYSAEGLSMNPAAGEPPDHAAVELEFMAVLCDLEAAAWSGRRAEGGSQTLSREQQFLRRHLGRWFPHLAQAVAMTGEGGFYAVASDAAAGFIHHDQDLVDLLLSRLAAAAPSAEEPVRDGGR